MCGHQVWVQLDVLRFATPVIPITAQKITGQDYIKDHFYSGFVQCFTIVLNSVTCSPCLPLEE